MGGAENHVVAEGQKLLEDTVVQVLRPFTLLHSLTNLAALRQSRVFFIALPLPIESVDSMPVRAVAIEF